MQQNEAPTAINDQEAQCYLNRYADLQKAFGATNIAAAKGHWVQYGKNEKRDWSCPDKKIVTNTAGMCCGKTDNNWESDSLNQLSKRVDTSSCGFKDDNVVYITSLGGNSDHWRTTGDTAYSESSSSSFVTKLLMHPTQYSPDQAKARDWHINWCGVGDRGLKKVR